MNSQEMRKFKRVPFSSSENIDAICKVSDENEGFIRLHIANISEGGLGLMVSKKAISAIHKNDILQLDKIVGNRSLHFVTNLELEVKWVLDSVHMETFGFGCCFRNIPDSLKHRIISFMNAMDPYQLQA